MNDLIAGLLAWAAAQMGQPAPPAPHVAFVAPDALVEWRYGAGAARKGAMEVVALYDPPSGTVMLRNDWRAADIVDRSVLLHEIVHHIQAVNRVPVPCRAQWEQQAYELQAEWLTANGIADPFAAMGVNRMAVKVLAMCGRS